MVYFLVCLNVINMKYVTDSLTFVISIIYIKQQYEKSNTNVILVFSRLKICTHLLCDKSLFLSGVSLVVYVLFLLY